MSAISSSDIDNSFSDNEDDLPTDRLSLEKERTRVLESIRQLEEETDTDFVLGCELLHATKQQQIVNAYARSDRLKQTYLKLYEYECEVAKATYASRCEQLKQEKSEEFQREIKRLKSSRDGVSVMDRRRFTRKSGGGLDGFGINGNNVHTPFTGDSTMNGGGPNGLTMAEESQRLQYEEKKRLEAMLSRSSIFQKLEHQAQATDIAADVQTILQMLPRPRTNKTATVTAHQQVSTYRNKITVMQSRRKQKEETEEQKTRDTVTQKQEIEEDDDEAAERRYRSVVGRRLRCNPKMLQEGQEVVVYRRRTKSDGHVINEDQEEDSPMECIMSGVITTATATQVFVLCPNGKFEMIDVHEWQHGIVSVQPVETTKHRTYK